MMNVALDDKYKEALERKFNDRMLRRGMVVTAEYQRASTDFYMYGEDSVTPYDLATVATSAFPTLTIGTE
jgi:hypothetical protein